MLNDRVRGHKGEEGESGKGWKEGKGEKGRTSFSCKKFHLPPNARERGS